MTVISGGKVLDQCPKCDKWVQRNKLLLGSMHRCISDCRYAGEHLGPIETERRWWRWWAVCRTCDAERRVAKPARKDRT